MLLLGSQVRAGLLGSQLPKIMWMCPTLIPEAPYTDSPQQPVFVVDPIQQKREQPMWARLRVQPKKIFSSKTKPKRRTVLKISQPVHLPSGQVDGLTKHPSSCSASRTWTADACACPSSWIKPPKSIPWYWQLPCGVPTKVKTITKGAVEEMSYLSLTLL